MQPASDDRIYNLDDAPDALHGCVLTVGNFDGVHLGHRKILDTCRDFADVDASPVVALTFDPPPDLVLRPDDVPQRIDPPAVKYRRLLEAGADAVVVAEADEELLAMAPEEFVELVLVRHFRPVHIVEGRNFYFGLQRSGNIQTLREAGASRGFVVHVAEPVRKSIRDETRRVSSTLVRVLVQAGRMSEACCCLGRPFALYGKVIPGAGHGRVLEFPTANIDPTDQVLPLDGVYAGRAVLGEETFPAAVSIGTKPTLGPSDRTIEAYLIGGRGDYYGRSMELDLLERLRDQQRFDGIEDLKEAIARDVQRVRELNP